MTDKLSREAIIAGIKAVNEYNLGKQVLYQDLAAQAFEDAYYKAEKRKGSRKKNG